VHFPVLRLPEHRNVIYNSLPTYMADEQDKLTRAGILAWHFIFSTESPREVDEVISAYLDGTAAQRPIRRLGRA
jgi:hypothetical protein